MAYFLAEEYAAGGKLEDEASRMGVSTGELLKSIEESLPLGLFRELTIKRREVISRAKPKRKLMKSNERLGKRARTNRKRYKRWTLDDPDVPEIAVAYLRGAETYKKIAGRLDLSGEHSVVRVLKTVYSKEDFAEMKEYRRRAILERKLEERRVASLRS